MVKFRVEFWLREFGKDHQSPRAAYKIAAPGFRSLIPLIQAERTNLQKSTHQGVLARIRKEGDKNWRIIN